MDTKHLVLLLVIVTAITISLPSFTESLANAADSKQVALPKTKKALVSSVCHDNLSLPKIELVEIRGRSYKIARQICELTSPGIASCGYFRTDLGASLELRIGSETRVLLYPETEVQISPMGASWPTVLNFVVHKGEVDFKTTRISGRKLRVITDGICVNPDLVNFKILFNPEICAGEIIVKKGILRATADSDPNRFCSLSNSFGISFTDGILKIPRRALIDKYQWKLNL